MSETALRVHWQYIAADGWDIGGQLYAAEDAATVRAWEGDICLLEVSRRQDGWEPTGGDITGWTEMNDRYPTPQEALSFLLGGAEWVAADEFGDPVHD
jgi:hypothetical protein